MKRMKLVSVFVGTIVFLSVYFGWKLTARAAYESAEYSVVQTDGEFEIRDYPDLSLVSTPMKSKKVSDNGSFMRLFRYISGSNKQSQKVAMTTPVFMDPDDAEAGGRMSFVLPKVVASQGAPQPTSEQVEVIRRPAGRFAVIRFAGRINAGLTSEKEAALRRWMQTNGFVGESVAEVAGYDPPWTPSRMRRNEILIRIAHPPLTN